MSRQEVIPDPSELASNRGSEVGPAAIERIAGAVATVPVVAMAALRIGLNAPVRLPEVVTASYGVVLGAAIVAPAAAMLGIGIIAENPLDRVGLVATGVFGMLAAFVPAVRVPATGVIVVGAAVALGVRLSSPTTWRSARPVVAAGTLIAAAAVSLGSTTGLLPPPTRTAGSALAMGGLAATPAFLQSGRREWIAGVLAFAAVVYAGVTAPFVTGAVVLVGVAVVNLPLLLVALGIAGGVTTLARAGFQRQGVAALGAGCLLAAGVPTTIPRALAVVLGLVLLIDGGNV